MTSTTSEPRPDPSRPGPGGAAILIVEDEPELVRALRINLRARQYDVRTAGTGREALALAASHPPDAIILDLGLPEWRILEVLLRRPGQLVGSAQLLTAVWGPGFQQRTNYLRFHMARLRRKLEDNPARPRHLLTEPGMGYRYQP
jgi:two-component system, OmpR family, KDP operon response regulator KdpE